MKTTPHTIIWQTKLTHCHLYEGDKNEVKKHKSSLYTFMLTSTGPLLGLGESGDLTSKQDSLLRCYMVQIAKSYLNVIDNQIKSITALQSSTWLIWQHSFVLQLILQYAHLSVP